jgi:hypothetical protein
MFVLIESGILILLKTLLYFLAAPNDSALEKTKKSRLLIGAGSRQIVVVHWLGPGLTWLPAEESELLSGSQSQLHNQCP